MVDIKTVGVIGAGQMGSGIAHVVALGGYDVLLHDVSGDRIPFQADSPVVIAERVAGQANLTVYRTDSHRDEAAWARRSRPRCAGRLSCAGGVAVTARRHRG